MTVKESPSADRGIGVYDQFRFHSYYIIIYSWYNSNYGMADDMCMKQPE